MTILMGSPRSNRERFAAFCATLAIVVLVAGLPSFAGLVIVARPSGPTLTLNICHPLQGLNQAADNVPLARPEITPVAVPLRVCPVVPAPCAFSEHRTADAPDPPPPKPAV